MSKNKHNSWFAIRKELSSSRRSILTFFSFLTPVLLWCAVSYIPFFWHPDMQLTISADRENVTTAYTAGDHVSKAFFPTFTNALREENKNIEEGLQSGDAIKRGKRANLKILRHLGPWAVSNDLLSDEDTKDDAKLFALWGQLSNAKHEDLKFPLSDENQLVIQKNWERLNESMSEYNYRSLPNEALFKLIPQGVSTNPVYLPAPHKVIEAGIKDFTATPEEGKQSMMDRVFHSVRIVFSGFLLAALVGLPIGILCGTYDFFSRLFEPFIDFFRYMPAPAFSTLLVAVFLAHDAPKIALVFVGTLFQLVLVIANTTRQLDRSLIEAAQTLGSKGHRLIVRVIIPGILPKLYNDLRILLGWAWTWLVIAELIGVKSGLTEFIETQGRWRNFDRVFPVIIAIGFIGFFTDQILAILRGFIFPWTGETPNAAVRGTLKALNYVPQKLVEGRMEPEFKSPITKDKI